MVILESTVHSILETLQPTLMHEQATNQHRSSPGANSVHGGTTESVASSLATIISSQPVSRHTRFMRRREIEEIGQTYIKYCADQPLPLFPREGFVNSLLDRADATLFAIIANSLRCTSQTGETSRFADPRTFRDAAYARIMVDVGQGHVAMTTLQALCLVVLFDFTGMYQHLTCSNSRLKTFISWPHADSFIVDGTDVNACFEYGFPDCLTSVAGID